MSISFAKCSTFAVLTVVLAGCFGPSEPAETDMKSAYNQFMADLTKLASLSTPSYNIREFKKHGCKESTLKPGYVCDFLVDVTFTGGMFPAIRNNLTGRFFQGQDGKLVYVQELA